MKISTIRTALLTVSLVSLGLLACSDSSDPEVDDGGGGTPGETSESGEPLEGPDQPLGHHRMVRALAQVADRSAADNPYVGDFNAKIWGAKLAALPESPSAQRLSVLVNLAEAGGSPRQGAIGHLSIEGGLQDPSPSEASFAGQCPE